MAGERSKFKLGGEWQVAQKAGTPAGVGHKDSNDSHDSERIRTRLCCLVHSLEPEEEIVSSHEGRLVVLIEVSPLCLAHQQVTRPASEAFLLDALSCSRTSNELEIAAG